MELQASLSWLALTMTSQKAATCRAPVAQAIFKKQNFWREEKELDGARRVGCKLVNWTEPEYPQSLLQIYDPPAASYVRGDASILNGPGLAIVGTQRPTVYGTQMADRMGRDLASRGLAMVSGLARGVDSIARQGATEVGGERSGTNRRGLPERE
jgi:predicted Rossmann fold nucleotide-binding protein DprA/Smf involved in DNA uptake